MNLEKLTDKQKLLLSKLSCLEFDIEKFEELRARGIKVTIKDLIHFLKHPDNSYFGLWQIDVKARIDQTVESQKQIIQQLVYSGLGGLDVTDIAEDPKINFKAIAFMDSNKNKGMSFTGTDFERMFNDEDKNIYKYFKMTPEQKEAAEWFYKLNKNPDEKSHLYGYSVGGGLAADIYKKYWDIQSVFTINAPPIKTEHLTRQQIENFSDREKCTMFTTTGNTSCYYYDEQGKRKMGFKFFNWDSK